MSKPTKFYEVMDARGDLVWGGAHPIEAVRWFRRGLDNTLFVSVWDEENEDDFRLLNDKIDISALVLATLADEAGRK